MPLTRKVKFGLFPKFLLSFLLMAIVPLLLIEYLTFRGMRDFRLQVVDQSKNIITQLSTENIKQKATDVAAGLSVYFKLYAKTHLKKEGPINIFFKSKSDIPVDQLKNDQYLKSIALQPVGKTGYTAVYTSEAMTIFHKNPKIVGLDLHKLKNKLPNFWKIMAASLKGPSSGYYNWKDIHGKIRKKYMFCAPVKGTNLHVAATTYLDEFFSPINALEASATEQQKSVMYYILIVSIGLIIYMIAFSYIYARSITKPILHLADVADRISVGDLDANVNVKTSDEIMILADAISRMQKSLKSAIVRLREKRKKERL
jgi:nitrogen fixation/metabolism regulation signal transduction histidine kinase